MNPKEQIKKMLDRAGIEINGSRDFDIQIKDERFYDRILTGGSLAVGESYMDGWWEVKALDQFFYKIFKSGILKSFNLSLQALLSIAKAKIFNMQSFSRSFEVGEKH